MTQLDLPALDEATLHPPRWQPYPAYKASGIAWLGAIPAHWEVKRLKYVAGVNMGQSPDSKDCNLEGIGIPFLQGNGEFGLLSPTPKLYCEVPRKLARPMDILLSVRAPVGEINVADQMYGIGRGLAAITPQHMEGNYLWFLLRIIREELASVATGSTYDAVSIDEVGNLSCCLPPLPEQRIIAAFLDRETAHINALIAKKEQLIALLQEKRAALISHAVTRGLDAAVPLKASGVPWLGSVPAHWGVKRLKYNLYEIEQGWSPECENRRAEDDEWAVLKVGCVNGTTFNAAENKALPLTIEPLLRFEIRAGDILMSRANTRELLGSAAIVPEVRSRLLLCDKLYRLRIRFDKIDANYLVLLLRSRVTRFQFERDATGASNSMQNISQEIIRNLTLSFPPLAEQQAIAAYLDWETAKLDGLISVIQVDIKKLQEYSTALISAAVTGKIDVREVRAMREE